MSSVTRLGDFWKIFFWHCQTTGHSITPHLMNRSRRCYTVVTLLYGLCYCPRQFLFRIGRVTKFLIKVAQMFLIKVAQMYGVFLGYCWKESLSKSKLLGLLWSNFCPLFISTSGHTEEMKETEWSQHWNTLNDYSVYILGRCHLVFQVFCTR